MATASSPYGLQPVQRIGSDYNNGGYTEYSVTTNNTAVIAKGDPVALVGGSIVNIGASPAAGTVSANTPVGVFMGCSYQDPTFGFVNREYLPANAVTGNLTQIKVKVADNPDFVFKIQGNAQISPTPATALAAIGKNVAISGWASGSTVTGQSAVVATTGSTATTSTLALRIIGFESNPANSPTDTYPDLLVKWNANTHAYSQATAQ